jgi:hypothetical protein
MRFAWFLLFKWRLEYPASTQLDATLQMQNCSLRPKEFDQKSDGKLKNKAHSPWVEWLRAHD